MTIGILAAALGVLISAAAIIIPRIVNTPALMTVTGRLDHGGGRADPLAPRAGIP